MRILLIYFIRFYQYLISPMLGNHCRYSHTCSNYTLEAISTHGIFVGLPLSLRRLLSCHPWSPGGYDSVPEAFEEKSNG